MAVAVGLMLLTMSGADAPVARTRAEVERFEPLRAFGFTAGRVDYSPDGRRIAAAAPGRVSFVDAQTYEVDDLQLLSESRMPSMQWSPTGEYIATGHDRGDGASEVTLWDVEQGRIARTLVEHTRRVVAVAFSPEGQFLASAGNDGRINIWDVATGTLLRSIGAGVTSLSWSPDGRELAYGALNGAVYIRDLEAGQVRELRGHTGGVISVAWRPDGRYLASGGQAGDGTVRIWDAATGTLLRTLAATFGDNHSLEWSPDGTLLASGGGEIRIWEPIVTGRLVRTLGEGLLLGILSVSWDPSGTHLASGGADGLGIWEVATGERLTTVFEGHDGEVKTVAWSPDGDRLASGGEGRRGGRIVIWDVARGRSIRAWVDESCEFRLPVSSLAWHPNGRWLASANNCGIIRVWEVKTGDELAQFRHYGGQVTWSPDGRFLGSTLGTRITIWDVEAATPIVTLTVPQTQRAGSIAWSPDSRSLAACCAFEPIAAIKVWAVGTWELVTTLRGLTIYWIRNLTWSPDSRHLAGVEGPCCLYDIKIWELETGELVRRISDDFTVYSLAWSPAGPYLASGGTLVPLMANATVKIWDADTGSLLRTLLGHGDVVRAVRWSPDGRYLASGSLDTTVRLWGVRAETSR